MPPAAFQAQTTILYDANGRQLAVLHGGENRLPVALSQVPTVLQDAVVATEDRNFFRHGGVDPLGILRATWADIRHRGSVQGGSTITQQYVKNVYVGRERTLARKLREAVIAVKLERKLDKHTILERYLNTIYLGRGAYGVEAASRAYFGKDVEQLGLPEAAYLAGLIRSPTTADASVDPIAATHARTRALDAMVRARVITAAQRADVERVPVTSYVVGRTEGSAEVEGSATGTQYFVEYVRRELVRRYGEDLVVRGGLRVQTTLDPALQADAYDAVYGVLDRPSDPAGALVALDADGNVRAMVGGRDWNVSKVNLAVGAAGGGSGRQGGSAFKPFVLAEAVREGYTVESSFLAPAKIVLPKADRGRDWAVSNYEGESFPGRLNLIDATAQSVNTVYAQLVTALGPARVVDLAHRLGITSPLAVQPSITLGTSDVSVLEMADAYLTFANEGVHVAPRVITKVTTADGTVLDDAGPTRTRVLERAQTDVVNFVLRQVVEHGTGTGANFGHPLAGKTGTTENYGDAWFVGYTRKLTAAVWMGYPSGQSKPMLDVHGRKVNGGSLPATIFERFMAKATRGVDTGDFPALTSFPGRVLGARVPFTIPTSSTTSTISTASTSPSTTPTTGGPAIGPTTTARVAPTSTVAPTTTVTTRPRATPTTRRSPV